MLTEEEQVVAKLAANIEVYDNGSTTPNVTLDDGLMADGDTAVVFTVTGVGTFTNNTSDLKVVVEGEAKGLTSAADQTFTGISVFDTTRPFIESIVQTGPKQLVVTFNEPVKDGEGDGLSLTTAAFKVDSGTIGITNVSASTATKQYKEVTLDLTSDLTDGDHTLQVNPTNVAPDKAVKDGYGWEANQPAVTFTATANTDAPVVTVKSATPTEVVLQLDKAVSNAEAGTTQYYHTAKAVAYRLVGTDAEVDYDANDKTITLDFSNVPLASGDVNIFIDYADGTTEANKIKDNYNNVVAAQTLVASVAVDTTKPEVSSVAKASSTTLEVRYSEKVNVAVGGAYSAINKNNYSLMLGGKAVSINSVTAHPSKTNTFIVTTSSQFAGGAYALTISNVKDLASTPNMMDAYSTTIDIADTIAPYITNEDGTAQGSNAYIVDSANKKVAVYFSEAMNTADLTTLTNYQNSADGYANPTEVVVSDDAKSVVLTFANATTGGNIIVGQMKDAHDVKMQTLSVTLSVTGASAPGLLVKTDFDSVQVVSKNTVNVYLDTVIYDLTKDDFAVKKATDGSWEAPAAVATSIVDGKTMVIITTTTEFGTGAFANPPAVQTVANSSANATTQATAGSAKDAFDAKLNITATNAVDKASPTITETPTIGSTAYTTLDADADGKIDHILVEFSEPLNGVTLDKDDFTVEGYTVLGVMMDSDGALTKDGTHTDDLDNAYGDGVATAGIVAITVAENAILDGTAVPNVAISADKVTDIDGNSFAGLVATASEDKVGPILTAATLKDTIAVGNTALGQGAVFATTPAATTTALTDLWGANALSIAATDTVKINGNANGSAVAERTFVAGTKTLADMLTEIEAAFGLSAGSASYDDITGFITVDGTTDGIAVEDLVLTAEENGGSPRDISDAFAADDFGYAATITVTFSEAVDLTIDAYSDLFNLNNTSAAIDTGNITAADDVSTFDVSITDMNDLDASNATHTINALGVSTLVDQNSNQAETTAVDIEYK